MQLVNYTLIFFSQNVLPLYNDFEKWALISRLDPPVTSQESTATIKMKKKKNPRCKSRLTPQKVSLKEDPLDEEKPAVILNLLGTSS